MYEYYANGINAKINLGLFNEISTWQGAGQRIPTFTWSPSCAQGRCEDDGAKTARKSLRREGEKPANEMKRNVCINDLIEFQCKFS